MSWASLFERADAVEVSGPDVAAALRRRRRSGDQDDDREDSDGRA